MNYYLLDKDNQQIGPFSKADLRTRLVSQTLCDTDWVWQDGWTEWKQVRSILKPVASIAQAAPATASIPGHTSALQGDLLRVLEALSPARTPDENIVKFRAAPFILAFFCFFLPFVNFSCSVQPNLGFDLTGLQLVTGAEVYVVGEVHKTSSMASAGFPILAVLVALAFSVPADIQCRAISGIAAVVGVISLFIVKSMIASEIMREGKGIVAANFLFGFWAVIMLLAIGSLTQFYLGKKSKVPDRTRDQMR